MLRLIVLGQQGTALAALERQLTHGARDLPVDYHAQQREREQLYHQRPGMRSMLLCVAFRRCCLCLCLLNFSHLVTAVGLIAVSFLGSRRQRWLLCSAA
jgi:hypothetical protein